MEVTLQIYVHLRRVQISPLAFVCADVEEDTFPLNCSTIERKGNAQRTRTISLYRVTERVFKDSEHLFKDTERVFKDFEQRYRNSSMVNEE